MIRFVRLWALLALVNLAGCMAAGAKPEPMLLEGGETITVLGDSITQGGTYIQYIDAYLTTRFPDRQFAIYNLGLSSETASGLSEPDHPFPRPNIHDRLDRALEATKPDVVTVCYGMNDGIYHPLGEERFAAYREGITKLVERIEATGAKVVLITPPIYDNVPVMNKTVGPDAKEFGYKYPYRGYDEVLAAYGKWIMSQRGEVARVVDLHTPMAELTRQRRQAEPDFTLAKDGVHPGPMGHWMMAQSILLGLGMPAVVEDYDIDAGKRPGEQRYVLKSKLPMPLDPRWDAASVKASGLGDKLNRYTLTIRNLPAKKYRFAEGDRTLGEVTAAQLAAGIDLNDYELSTVQRAAEVLKLIQKQRGLLDPAWRAAWIGKGKADLAKAEAEAAKLEQQIRKLSQPVTLDLRLIPIN